MAVRRVPREAPEGVRERPPVLATAASRQAKHHPVYPGASTVRGAIRDRLGDGGAVSGLIDQATTDLNVPVQNTHVLQ